MYIENRIEALESTVAILRAKVAKLERVTRTEGPPAPPVPVTYASGSTPGRVDRITDMPTRHLRNVLNMPDYRVVIGLRQAIEDEIAARTREGRA